MDHEETLGLGRDSALSSTHQGLMMMEVFRGGEGLKLIIFSKRFFWLDVENE